MQRNEHSIGKRKYVLDKHDVEEGNPLIASSNSTYGLDKGGEETEVSLTASPEC